MNLTQYQWEIQVKFKANLCQIKDMSIRTFLGKFESQGQTIMS
jgi:hypothetical protein